MNLFMEAFKYFFIADNWTAAANAPIPGMLVSLLQHLQYTGIGLGFSILIAVPVGMIVGHTGKGELVIVGFVNAIRALPTLGILTLFALLMGLGLVPPMIVLVLLGVPPLLAGTYAGMKNVDQSSVQAARAMGMREWRVMVAVELPNALPLIMAGLRSATLQVVSTATVVAFINLGGLGRYLFDGLAQYDYVQVLVGAILVTVLAIALDALMAYLVWLSEPATNRLLRPSATVQAEINERISRT